MGSIIYNFFSESIFSHDDSIINCFKNETESRLQKELQDYREFCISNYEELISEIRNKKSSLKVFSSTEKTSIDLLKQTALYIDQFILADPLFKHTELRSEISNLTSKHLGYQESKLDRDLLSNSCKFLKELTPMIVGDYVKIFPLSYYFERPDIPFYAPTDSFNDILPSEILNFFKENAVVNSLERLPSGGWGIQDGKLYPCRGISVEFKDSDLSSGMIYHLVKSEVISVDEASRNVVFRQSIPDTPPEKEEFLAWVNQSINSASKKFYDEALLENIIAANLNSTYLCDNIFTSDLISKHFNVNDSIQTYTANQIINIELPFLQEIDVEKLMTIRETDSDVFTSFRLELEKQFRELRSITDESQLKLKAQNIFHELNDVQGQKIKQKISSANKKMRINSLLAIGGLIGSVQTSGISLIATALAIGKGYSDHIDYKEKVTENPAYLLWKIKRDK